jgi:hypothetical protein
MDGDWTAIPLALLKSTWAMLPSRISLKRVPDRKSSAPGYLRRALPDGVAPELCRDFQLKVNDLGAFLVIFVLQ